MNNWTALLLGLILSMLLAVLILRFTEKKKWQDTFHNRSSQNLKEIYNSKFKSYNYNDFIEIWSEVALALAMNPDKLKLTDRFDDKLSVTSKLFCPQDNLYHYCDVFAVKYDAEINFSEIDNIEALVSELLRVKYEGKRGRRN